MGVHQKDMYLSLRALSKNVNAAKLIRDIIQGFGTGGGHEIMAGGKIPGVSIGKLSHIENIVIQRLLEIFSLSEVKEKRFFH